MKLILAVLALLPDIDELCESATPYSWMLARCLLRLLEAMLLSEQCPQEAFLADFARFEGVPIVARTLATRKGPSKVVLTIFPGFILWLSDYFPAASCTVACPVALATTDRTFVSPQNPDAQKPDDLWRWAAVMQNASSFLAAACGPPPHLKDVVALTPEGTWMRESETGWGSWRAQYAGLLVDGNLGIAALVRHLQWAEPDKTIRAAELLQVVSPRSIN